MISMVYNTVNVKTGQRVKFHQHEISFFMEKVKNMRATFRIEVKPDDAGHAQ